MAVRVRTRWHTEKDRSLDELAGALAFTIWKIGMHGLLELENEGFMTYSNDHRLQVMSEFLVFLVQATDRLSYERLDAGERQAFITALALHLARTFVENKRELLGPGEYQAAFIEFLNRRAEEYSELAFADGEPKMDFLRHFGACVEKVIGDSQNKYWVNQHIIEIDAPDAIKTLKKSLATLLQA